MCIEYNGFDNKATWIANLEFGPNDRLLDELVNDSVDVVALEYALKDIFNLNLPLIKDQTASALLSWAASRINWGQLANLYWQDFRKEEESEEE